MKLCEAVCKIRIGKIIINQKNGKGSGMTNIIIVFLLSCTLAVCSFAYFSNLKLHIHFHVYDKDVMKELPSDTIPPDAAETPESD